MKELNLETQFILSEAQESGDPDIALKSIARLEKQLELEARLLGELNEQTRIAIGINNAPQQQATYDLTVLTDDELDELHRLYRKMGAAMATFIDKFVLVAVAALTVAALSVGSAHSEQADPVAWITQYERDAATADLAGDVSFYQRNLADDWSDGMSNGEFQSKKELISDLTDTTRNITFHETLADMKVRAYGNTAVATYTETYDALIAGNHVARTIITTDTFAKIRGQWKLVAAHSSAVAQEAHERIIGSWELVSTEEQMTDGSRRPYTDVGPKGKGYLMYTADGHMCATGMNPDRPAWSDVNKPTDAEKLQAMEGFFGYCGRYKIDTANHVIYHYPEVALDPNLVATEQKRPYKLDGDVLTFSDKDTAPGVERYAIRWKKLK